MNKERTFQVLTVDDISFLVEFFTPGNENNWVTKCLSIPEIVGVGQTKEEALLSLEEGIKLTLGYSSENN